MQLEFDTFIRDIYDKNGNYRDHPRRGRVYFSTMYSEMVTRWVVNELSCPRCKRMTLEEKYPVVRPAELTWQDFADIRCDGCGTEMLLIKTRLPIRESIQCSHYKPIVERIKGGNPLDIICIRYDQNELSVCDCLIIRGDMLSADYLTPEGSSDEVLEEPNKDTWCNIRVGELIRDTDGEAVIQVVKDGRIVNPRPICE